MKHPENCGHSTAFDYIYDANGSLISDGVKTYTYNSANRLVQVSDQLSVSSLSYNGLGQRLSMDAAGVIATYVLDGDRPLTATSNGNTTFYLYGLGGIGEETNAWSYSLPDGTNTSRQLSDSSGDITLSARYTPWGDTLDSFGTGNFTFGYLGGVLDAATGLLYVGNGQYYDPSTGRFLTRDVYPNSPNPYMPWNPLGAILGPLALVSLFYTRKKKGSKAGTFLVLLIVLGGVGMTLAACVPAPTPPGSVNTAPPAMPAQTQTPVPTGGPGTFPVFPTGTPTAPIETPIPIPCPTPTNMLINTPTPPVPTPIGDRFEKIYTALMDSRYANHWWRNMDGSTEMILAVLAYLELRTIKSDSGFIDAATEVLARRYWYACPTGCGITNGVVDGGLKWVMRFSQSLMQIANGVTVALDQSSIDPAFAITMAKTVVRNPKTTDWSRPWGWFNPQNNKEFEYFREKWSSNGDIDPYHVYWWSPEGVNFPPVAIILTKWQMDTLCPPNSPNYVTCGN